MLCFSWCALLLSNDGGSAFARDSCVVRMRERQVFAACRAVVCDGHVKGVPAVFWVPCVKGISTDIAPFACNASGVSCEPEGVGVLVNGPTCNSSLKVGYAVNDGLCKLSCPVLLFLLDSSVRVSSVTNAFREGLQ